MDVFARMRYGDRYFYDNRGQAGSFTGGKFMHSKLFQFFYLNLLYLVLLKIIYLFRSIGTN